MAPVRTLDDLLKMRDVMDWVAIVRRGIAARIAVEAARRFDLATAELGSLLGLSAPTLYRLAREDKRLTPVASDALKDVSIVLNQVLGAFDGDASAMNSWLDAYNPSLGGAPRSLLLSRDGRGLISVTVDRGRYGSFG